MENRLEDLFNSFQLLTKKPEDYLRVQTNTATDAKQLVKDLYDFTKCAENGLSAGDALPELIIEDFDEEQIWQELELQNEGRSQNLITDVASLVSRKDRLKFPVRLKNEEIDVEEDKCAEQEEENDGSNENQAESEIDASDSDSPTAEKRTDHIRPSQVDDKFFKLSEMERFLELEEKRESGRHDSSDESIDLFQPSDEDSDDELRYDDFFDAPHQSTGKERYKQKEEEEEEEDEEDENEEENDLGADEEDVSHDEDKDTKKVRFLEESSSDEDEEGHEKLQVKSSLERRQERIQSRIKELEEQALAEKPWQLKGEVSASVRPQNSLLEEVVDFDLTVRPAPVMTEKTTLQLEDIILQRVKDRAWDDVERKVKPVETPNEYKKKLVLDHEKSKLSLAQVYEQEYLKQQEAQEADDGEGRTQEEPPEHQEVRTMMKSLFRMLDALSNFHFTPKQPDPEVKIVSNLPAISLEEVAPVATSDAALLAPEEIKERPKGDVVGKAERTSTDKKRERRQKKMKQRERQRERDKRERAIEKLKPGLGNKYSKERALRDLERVTKDSNVTQIIEKDNAKSVKSSAAFFNRLQDEVKSHIKRKSSTITSDQKQKIKSAKKLKL
ncbi:hypothetical protein ANN_22991 [Periplaneta americana]|uniref:U3 small nucleolar ribonucleoprotein protein MPP10 n=1 Tax=Periplaneta americana TaxID=6978 RepID=A0ABQ8SJU3_PERAM|nr:hypothetical protein ANN_22991 [Periplaneta americana]